MGKLSDEEKATLEALTKKQNEADESDDFNVEWWEEDAKGNRRGGSLPWSKGKSIYGRHFPDLFGEKPPEGGPNDPPKDDKDDKQRPSQKYFGRS